MEKKPHRKKYKGHWYPHNKVPTYEYEYKCYEDCSMFGCPSHIAEMGYQSTSDVFWVIFRKGEENERKIYFDVGEMGMIADFINKLSDNK
jgi:hypothetical protein